MLAVATVLSKLRLLAGKNSSNLISCLLMRRSSSTHRIHLLARLPGVDLITEPKILARKTPLIFQAPDWTYLSSLFFDDDPYDGFL